MLSAGATLGLGLVGGCVGLDRTAFFQGALARPLVGASLTGTVLGAPILGLWCGVLLELLWLAEAPLGAFVPPDEALAGVLAVVLAWAAPAAWSSEARVALGVVLAVPCGGLGRWLDMGVRRWNDALVQRARRGLEQGVAGALGRAHLLGIGRFFLAGALGTVVLGHAGVTLVEGVVPLAPPGLESGLELVALLLPALGAGAVLARWRGARQSLRFVCGAALWGAGPVLSDGLPWRR